MHDNPVIGRRLLASNRRINPILAAAAPHDPRLAEQVGHILISDVEALVDTLPAADADLSIPERMAVIDQLERCLWQIDDARTTVQVARDEAS